MRSLGRLLPRKLRRGRAMLLSPAGILLLGSLPAAGGGAAAANEWMEWLKALDPRILIGAGVALLAFVGFFQKAMRFLARLLMLLLMVGGIYLAYAVWKQSGGSFERGMEFLHELGAGGEGVDQREAFARAGARLDQLLDEARGQGSGVYREVLEQAGQLLEERMSGLPADTSEDGRRELERLREEIESRLRQMDSQEGPPPVDG